MPADITITPRRFYLEDIDYTTDPTGVQTASVNVLGAPANPVTLTKPSLYLLTDLTQAANDAAAAVAGVPIGGHYWSTTYNAPHTRMT